MFVCALFAGTQSRYTVLEQPGGISILRIEPVRAGRDDAPYECVAENGVGDAVHADATLTIYEGKCHAILFRGRPGTGTETETGALSRHRHQRVQLFMALGVLLPN